MNNDIYPASLLKQNRAKRGERRRKTRGRRKFSLKDWREAKVKEGDDERDKIDYKTDAGRKDN